MSEQFVFERFYIIVLSLSTFVKLQLVAQGAGHKAQGKE
jgi:hypothetical protein